MSSFKPLFQRAHSTPLHSKQSERPIASRRALLEDNPGVSLGIQGQQQVLPLVAVPWFEHVYKDDTRVQRSFDLRLLAPSSITTAYKTYVKVHLQMITAQSILFNRCASQVSLSVHYTQTKQSILTQWACSVPTGSRCYCHMP